jgi:hypothetical protein
MAEFLWMQTKPITNGRKNKRPLIKCSLNPSECQQLKARDDEEFSRAFNCNFQPTSSFLRFAMKNEISKFREYQTAIVIYILHLQPD